MQFSAECNSQHFEMGDLIPERSAPVQFSISVPADLPLIAEIVKDGNIEKLELKNGAAEYRLPNDGKRHWVRLNVRDKNGKLLALTNPIYLNFERAE